MDAVVELIKDIQANQGKASEADLNVARNFQRKAQFFWITSKPRTRWAFMRPARRCGF